MNGRNGFTLIELMVSSAIAMAVGLAITMLLKVNQQSWEVSHAYFGSSLELRRAAAMSRELVAAVNSTVSIPADGAWYNTISFRVPQDMNGDGVVVFSNGSLEMSNPITYSLGGSTGNLVIRTQEGKNDRAVALGVSALQFRRQAANPEMVEIQITVQRGMGDFKNQGSWITRVRMRN